MNIDFPLWLVLRQKRQDFETMLFKQNTYKEGNEVLEDFIL